MRMPHQVVPLALILAIQPLLHGQESSAAWPRRVLITNDNGIDDPKVAALARAFSAQAQTWVVAPQKDRSGSSNLLSVTRTGRLMGTRKDLGTGISAWAVDGYPADCVLLARYGILRDNPPDLVVSGINGGANLAHDWFGSGTIGAARTGAFLGLPAIAVSGLDDDIPGAVEAATGWIVELAQSPLVRNLRPGQYLTVSIPRLPPSSIKGVRIAERAGLLLDLSFKSAESGETKRVWTLAMKEQDPSSAPGRDAALDAAGYIVVVPMRADEHDRDLLGKLQASDLPAWSPAAPR
ncbi:MAG: 5'/3'-nucleotidase SurE [Vicinamibacteraceae bacterium]